MKTFFKSKKTTIPVWLMRQAGRYLPEYREIRKNAGIFLDLCYNKDLACEVTLQPIKRFDFDAAIIFSDILVIPDALGVKVDFLKGDGPMIGEFVLEKLHSEKDAKFYQKLAPVYEAIKLSRRNLNPEKSLIGFCGAPWTLATYMIEKEGSKAYSKVKALAYNDPIYFQKLIKKLENAVVEHLENQINAGADVVQIFDSWSGVLNKENFYRWIIEPSTRIVAQVKSRFPHVKIICFPRKAGHFYLDFVENVNCDAISIDSDVDLDWVREYILPKKLVQGNLDPVYLLSGDKWIIEKQVRNIIDKLGENMIFNLGHGILPETKIENVEFLVELVRSY